jgi:hypothetical protein
MRRRALLSGLCGTIFLVLSCQPAGNVIWERRYDSGEEDFGRAVATDGNDVVVGGTWRDTTGSAVTVGWRLLKYDADGSLVWDKTMHRGAATWLSDLVVTPAHEIIAVGSTSPDNSDTVKLLLAKYSSDGYLLWDREYAFGLASQGMAMCLDRGEGVAVCGWSFTPSGNTDDDVLLARFDVNGRLTHSETLDFGARETGQDITRDRAGNFVLVGGQMPKDEADSVATADLLIVKLDSLGRPLWRRIYDSGEDDLYGSVAADSLGRVHAAVTFADDAGTSIHLLEYSAQGELRSDRPFDRGANAACTAILLDKSGALLGTGAEGPDAEQSYLGFRYTHNWLTRFLTDGAYVSGDNDVAYDIAQDQSGNVVITGVSDPGVDPDILTIKLRHPGAHR